MKSITLTLFILALFIISCQQKTEEPQFKIVNWDSRSIDLSNKENLHQGSTYLSVYSEIFDMTEETKHQLTATVSIRNISSTDSVFIKTADYFNTKGDLIRSYLIHPAYVKPLETLEIVIYRTDTSGGSGGNFVFEWASKNSDIAPHFEAVMIWTTGTQGISFTTTGVKR